MYVWKERYLMYWGWVLMASEDEDQDDILGRWIFFLSQKELSLLCVEHLIFIRYSMNIHWVVPCFGHIF